ncbi:TRAP transporter substrate-binding protein [Natrarchaeobaculum aegyptiacum]|uniref:TRAP transporter substrate-binding protein n=1 Tax=Natrarchaeobaculum aegyptiacum TaxID=745377 RepID=UPI000A3D7CE5|nr:TRAP transporter substrate-binding protein [Natrarchaeobaculum aegyptiacum]
MGTNTTSRRTVLRRAALGTGGVAIAALAGCTDDDGGLDFTLASSYESGHINVEAAEAFSERIEEETDGEITIEVSPGGAYGAEDEITEQVADDLVEMHSGAGLPIHMYAPEYYIIDQPFVMDDVDHLFDVLESDLFQPSHDMIIENGNQRQLGQRFYRGQRYFTANTAVEEPADVEGIDMRSPPLDSWIEIWSEIGVNTTSVALDELYSALQQGVVDAAEGDVEQIHSFNYYEVQDYLCATRHAPFSGALYINESVYQDLSEADQDLFEDVAAEVTEEANETAFDREEERIDDLVDEGMTFVEDVDRQAFRDAAEPVIDSWFEDEWAETWEDWRNV